MALSSFVLRSFGFPSADQLSIYLAEKKQNIQECHRGSTTPPIEGYTKTSPLFFFTSKPRKRRSHVDQKLEQWPKFGGNKASIALIPHPTAEF
jgi:hypothetical protein